MRTKLIVTTIALAMLFACTASIVRVHTAKFSDPTVPSSLTNAEDILCFQAQQWCLYQISKLPFDSPTRQRQIEELYQISTRQFSTNGSWGIAHTLVVDYANCWKAYMKELDDTSPPEPASSDFPERLSRYKTRVL